MQEETSIKYKITIEYNGFFYFGMQEQKTTHKTIETSLKKAISIATSGAFFDFDFCGRTDAGVHAFGQVCHFSLPSENNFKKETEKLQKAINFYLNKAEEHITILETSIVPKDFHSRFSCKSRRYRYLIFNRPEASMIYKNLSWHIPHFLDIKQMQDASQIFLGEHNFENFRSTGCYSKSAQKTINEISILKDDNFILIEIEAKSFLYRMVRNITGALKDIGSGRLTREQIQLSLDLKLNKLHQTAPAVGLYFLKAKY